jgi:hypothetical protein
MMMMMMMAVMMMIIMVVMMMIIVMMMVMIIVMMMVIMMMMMMIMMINDDDDDDNGDNGDDDDEINTAEKWVTIKKQLNRAELILLIFSPAPDLHYYYLWCRLPFALAGAWGHFLVVVGVVASFLLGLYLW